LEDTSLGAGALEPDALKLFQAQRASQWQTFVKLRFP
jgi:ABC-type nitrate/sulfonate/bicarbonate transport system permease component